MDNHFKINNSVPDEPLFAYKAPTERLEGHGIRIGATREYLLRGLSFEALKSIGDGKGTRSPATLGNTRKSWRYTCKQS